MRRRDLVRLLIQAGFVSVGGTKHECFLRGSVRILVKRHREIDDIEAKRILRQADLR